MKIFYLTILTFFLSISVYGQTVVDFTAEEGYEQGALDNNADWGGANWIASPNNSRIECAGGYSWARWGVPFTVSGTEITFEVHFRFNIDLPENKLIEVNTILRFEDKGAMIVTFCLYPGTYQPSGHINISRAREFYLHISFHNTAANGPIIAPGNPAAVVVVASAINFLLISDGSAVLRYST